ncbi:thioredoxin domain-containing protein [Chitinophaga sp. G-6-1-13]|uniref:Thioredoxin domain-containing protein n=1 Tax=Chitinophaga fulva TaxID=2728842 RepID=A0A848GTB7_9BACT|nr:thioredoxin domain-containing protein [Chitinophaga fulva]NML41604.1 thioredoxin domain-containing protein [Chitinophaga fulva]
MLTPPITSRDHVTGNQQGSTEIVEYGDFQCPYCGEAFGVVRDMLQALSNIKFVFRHFPLAESHEYAMDAALAAEAAARQQQFWQMHDALYLHQQELSDALFPELAKQLQLNLEQFKEDMQDNLLVSKVEADFESGIRSGVNGTPTFFINGKRFNGDYRNLLSAVRH